jgi:hypothetical protein
VIFWPLIAPHALERLIPSRNCPRGLSIHPRQAPASSSTSPTCYSDSCRPSVVQAYTCRERVRWIDGSAPSCLRDRFTRADRLGSSTSTDRSSAATSHASAASDSMRHPPSSTRTLTKLVRATQITRTNRRHRAWAFDAYRQARTTVRHPGAMDHGDPDAVSVASALRGDKRDDQASQ